MGLRVACARSRRRPSPLSSHNILISWGAVQAFKQKRTRIYHNERKETIAFAMAQAERREPLSGTDALHRITFELICSTELQSYRALPPCYMRYTTEKFIDDSLH